MCRSTGVGKPNRPNEFKRSLDVAIEEFCNALQVLTAQTESIEIGFE